MADTISPEIEALARMWLVCDPNRQGHDPDETIVMQKPLRQVPHWHWFIPRAEASLQFLAERGMELVSSDMPAEERTVAQQATDLAKQKAE